MQIPQIMSPPSILDPVLSILADGKPRTADEILAEGKRRGLFAHDAGTKPIYTALEQYIERMLARGRKPLVIHGVDHRFRLNRPVDDWPQIDATGLPALDAPQHSADASATLAELKKAAAGTDSDAFERAVCKALEVFGFAATHVGGDGSPDGYADAVLGELTYRVMIECKLSYGQTVSKLGSVAEAAKYRDAYHAGYCALVALSFDNELTFVSELHEHHVAAWSVSDLIRAADLQLDCSQMRDLFASGFASDALDDLAWTLRHGQAKRLRVVASLLLEIGLAQQRMALGLGDGASTPQLTVEAALGMVDDRLTAAGSAHGVTREEIDAAFTWLTSPYVGRALWTNDSRTAIVIRPRP